MSNGNTAEKTYSEHRRNVGRITIRSLESKTDKGLGKLVASHHFVTNPVDGSLLSSKDDGTVNYDDESGKPVILPFTKDEKGTFRTLAGNNLEELLTATGHTVAIEQTTYKFHKPNTTRTIETLADVLNTCEARFVANAPVVTGNAIVELIAQPIVAPAIAIPLSTTDEPIYGEVTTSPSN